MLDRARQLSRRQTSHKELAAVAETFTAFAVPTQRCLTEYKEQQSMGAPVGCRTQNVLWLVHQQVFGTAVFLCQKYFSAGKLSYCSCLVMTLGMFNSPT